MTILKFQTKEPAQEIAEPTKKTAEPTQAIAEPTQEIAGPTKEIRDAFAALTAIDHVLLLKVARILCKRSGYDSPESLIGEAMLRVWIQGRVWPKDRVEFVRFIIGVMRSISSAWRHSSLARRTDYLGSMGATEDGDFDATQFLPSPEPSCEEETIQCEEDEIREKRAKELWEKLQEHFKNDAHVLWLIRQLEEHHLRGGKPPSETYEDAGFTKKGYETVRKRLRRGLAKLQGRRIP